MKKVLVFFAMLIVSSLLVGCISIPLGDGGKLEVSKDGISMNPGEAEAEVVEVEEVEEIEEIEGKQEDEAVEEDVTEEESQDEKTDGNLKAVVNAESGRCGEFIEDPKINDRTIAEFLEFAPIGFSLPDCSLIDSMSDSYNSSYGETTIDAYIQVPGIWIDMYDYYDESFGELNFKEVKRDKNNNAKEARISGDLAEHAFRIHITQVDNEEEDIAKIRFVIYKYDEPREEYQND
ncbi:hypothetical protein ACFSFY_05170 [Sporosarcina siberiensis]|uniref:Lipoprotein n=1 Tax=Sporosarcina siberiensis TaxID=1365606 RepID=A0ABW4SDL3_9BACL